MNTRIALSSVLCVALLTGCSGGWFGKDAKKPLPGERISVLQLQKKLEPDHIAADPAAYKIPEPWKNQFWPQAGGYPNHAMQHLSLNTGELKLAWKADIGEGANSERPLTAQPVVGEGKVFTVDRDQNLSAFNLVDGKQMWRVNVRKKDEKDDVIGGGIAYSRGMVYITNGYDELFAVSADAGKLVWKANLPAPSRAAPTIMEDRVFVTTMDNRLLAFSADKGAPLWDYSGIAETAGLVGAASPAASSDIVVPAFSSGELDALLVENGTVSWNENLSGQRTPGLGSIPTIKGLPVIDNDLVFAISFGGRMVAIDQRTGQRAWQKDLASDVTPWVAGDQIFVLTVHNELLSMYRRTGSIRWVSPLPLTVDAKDVTSDRIYWTAPVLAGGRLITASSNGDIFELNPDDGKVIRQGRTGYKISTPLAVASDTLFMLADDGTLLAYR